VIGEVKSRIKQLEKENDEYKKDSINQKVEFAEQKIKISILEKENSELKNKMELLEKENLEYKKDSIDQKSKVCELEKESSEYKKDLIEQKNKMTIFEKDNEEKAKIITELNKKISSALQPPDYNKRIPLNFNSPSIISEKGFIFAKGRSYEFGGVKECYLRINNVDHLLVYSNYATYCTLLAPVEKGDEVSIIGGNYQTLDFLPCRK
jgi:hypothetical protein